VHSRLLQNKLKIYAKIFGKARYLSYIYGIILKIKVMKELLQLYKEAYKEAKNDPKEAILSVFALAFICAFTYYGLWFVHIIGA
tara:strand:- start:189 stop:440 length:252 start_codon:yes stop_codon:yes gene_type:complete